MNTIYVLLIFAVSFSGCTSIPSSKDRSVAQADVETADDLLGRDRIGRLESYLRQIQEAHAFNATAYSRFSTSWQKELQRSRKRFTEATFKEDVYYAMTSLVNSVRDGHTWVNFPKEISPEGSRRDLPLRFSPVKHQGKWQFVVYSSDDTRIRKGDSLVAIDGQPVEALMAWFEEWFSGNSRETFVWQVSRWLTVRNPKAFPSPEVGSAANLKLERAGKIYGIQLTWQDFKPPSYNPCESDSLEQIDYKSLKARFRGLNYCVYEWPGAVKIVRHSSYIYDYTQDELQKIEPQLSYGADQFRKVQSSDELFRLDQKELIQYLAREKAETVILDLRENLGGGLGYALVAAFAQRPFTTTKSQLVVTPYLRSDPQALERSVWGQQLKIYEQELRKNPSLKRTSLRPFFCKTEKCEISESVIPNTGELSRVHLWVLSGPKCASSCDQTLRIFKDNGIAKLVGMSGHGSSSLYRNELRLELANGTKFSMVLAASEDYGPSGSPIEAHPAKMNIQMEPTSENYDRYLQTLLRRIGF